uniref:Phosphofructokinase domain-containing protein n=1 Tax=Octactis speculum TaxID=3111310 RepID=A0A7S2E325_9STRA|mmetsp:Transcript_57108/g.77892  ORF Transcript_57108/g.77892 Transcript_57108/m.77892 type:complete len:323 (+) Transcript_57108:20-988(+)
MSRFITLFTLALAACTDGFNFAPQQTLFSRPTASSGRRESVVAQISRTIETDGLAFTVEDIPHLKNWIPDLEMHDTPLGNAPDSMMKTRPDPSFFVNEDDLIAAQVAHTAQEARSPQAFHRAGARAKVAFEVGEAKAAIATCGGLCPGLNTVVRELYLCLSRQYGVKTVLGIRDGYAGFGRIDKAIELTEEYVADIQKQGGTVLRSSRGGHDTMVICDALEAQGINMLFLVGGDGTMKGAVKIEDEMRRRGKKCVVGVVPKTIDNDVPVIDMSFGFNTAVQEAASHINAAYTEAAGCPNGIGVVRLMGRHSGFIAMTAVPPP